MQKVTFIGPGNMGMGMACNLAKGDYNYQVIARRPEIIAQLAEKGIRTSADNTDAATSDIVFLCLPNTTVVQNVLFGEDGLVALMHPGQIIVDCSTIDYLAAREISERCEAAGIHYMDCPVSGHQTKAIDGTLTIMCGGSEEIFGEIRPMLELMGTTVLYMGGSGCGQLTKMINNCVMNINIAAFCEMLPLGVRLGLPAERIGQVLMTATSSSYASNKFIPDILDGRFDGGFSLDKAYKDMVSMSEVSCRYEAPLPTFHGTMQTYQLALQKGLGEQYKGAMVRFYEEMLGVECRRSNE